MCYIICTLHIYSYTHIHYICIYYFNYMVAYKICCYTLFSYLVFSLIPSQYTQNMIILFLGLYSVWLCSCVIVHLATPILMDIWVVSVFCYYKQCCSDQLCIIHPPCKTWVSTSIREFPRNEIAESRGTYILNCDITSCPPYGCTNLNSQHWWLRRPVLPRPH